MAQKLDLDKAALILAEAMILGDKRAATKYGITTTTVRNYRKRSLTDEKLALNLQQKKDLAFSGWHDELKDAIMAGIDFVKRAAQEADPKDPNAIHAIAGATNLLLETQLRKEIIDAKFKSTTLGNKLGQTSILLDAIPSHIEK